MFDQILLPTDGSDPAEEALDVAINVADKFGADLHILSVVELVAYPEYPDMATAQELERDRMEDVVEDARQMASDQGLSVQTKIVQDVGPHDAINGYCAEHEIDLIVMGTHGRSGLERLLLGSTAERTLRTADIPILTVPVETD